MNTRYHSRDGFTLVEMLGALLLVGILAALTGMLLAPMAQTFLNTREAARMMQDGQLAMARLAREFTTVSNVVSSSSTTITYDTLDSAGDSHRRTLEWSGTPDDPLMLEGHTLIDALQRFELSYMDTVAATPQSSWGSSSTLIEVVLDLGAAGSSYTNRLYPRNVER
jgi:prepilin-type N-terminal cleavage/methylation domain-containing protein